MIINIIGDCDKRPVLYTVMKICQTLGDVLVVSSSSRLARLSDTRESCGHYQNTMIAITHEGIDDFFENFPYVMDDFEYIIIDNIVSAEANLTIYVEGLIKSDLEEDLLAYIDNYVTIPLYKGRLLDANTLRNCEEFEALRDMCPIGQRIAAKVAEAIASYFGKPAKNFEAMAMAKNPPPATDNTIKRKKVRKHGS